MSRVFSFLIGVGVGVYIEKTYKTESLYKSVKDGWHKVLKVEKDLRVKKETKDKE